MFKTFAQLKYYIHALFWSESLKLQNIGPDQRLISFPVLKGDPSPLLSPKNGVAHFNLQNLLENADKFSKLNLCLKLAVQWKIVRSNILESKFQFSASNKCKRATGQEDN